MIEPKVLKGFRDSMPEEESLRKFFIRKIEDRLSLFGYAPIDTPVLEYKEILTGKGGDDTDKQVFTFTDKGEREVGMRFDLTVPLARFVAAHENELAYPFKRYHISKVWRGEKPQRGRYREFFQADFDIIGSDAIGTDIEVLTLVHDIVKSLGVENFKIHVNDRSLLKEIFAKLELQDQEIEILRLVDKVYKAGKDTIKAELITLIGEEKYNQISFLLDFDSKNENAEKKFFENLAEKFDIKNTKLEKVLLSFEKRNLKNWIVLDPKITRGLDYYTGVVYETYLSDMSIGSVSSGGRYANLTGLFTKRVHSGIGGSIGLDRLIAFLAEQNQVPQNLSSSDVLIVNFSEEEMPFYFELANKLHSLGIKAEVYPENSKLKKQFTYAENKKIKLTLIVGENEKATGIMKVKNIKTFEEKTISNIFDIKELLK